MSEVVIPENLLLEIGYSSKLVIELAFLEGKLVSRNEYAPSRHASELTAGEIKAWVIPPLAALLGSVFCGITVYAAPTSDSDTVIRVYRLPDHFRCHRLYCDCYLYEVDAWLREFLNSAGPLYVYSAEAARGELGRPYGEKAPISDELDLPEDDVRDPTDHIPALRGLFALARGDYALVSPEDLTAAVDAGYVHPDVLACVADEIAYASATDELIAGLQSAASVPELTDGDVIAIHHRPSSPSDPFADLPEGSVVELVAEKPTWSERLSGLGDILFHLPMFLASASLFLMSATMFTLLIGTMAGWIE